MIIGKISNNHNRSHLTSDSPPYKSETSLCPGEINVSFKRLNYPKLLNVVTRIQDTRAISKMFVLLININVRISKIILQLKHSTFSQMNFHDI